MDTIALLKKVKLVEIKTRRLSDNVFGGEYHSSFKGRGIAFAEVRAYQPGDDVRSIDWNVTAKKGAPFIKVFDEERELTLMLLVDVSASGSFGSHGQEKRSLITEMCATLAFSAVKNNDKVGVIFFSDRIEKFIPPRKGKSHILRIIRDLIEFEPEGKGTDLAQAYEYLLSVWKKKAIVFTLSDFKDQGFEKPFKIAARRHDMNSIFIYDQFEASMPNLGLIPIIEAETGKTKWIHSGLKKVRQKHDHDFQKQKQNIEKLHSKSGAGIVGIGTHENYAKKLLGYFKEKGARR